MLKKNITYTDFNDKEVTETFYFNLSQSELVEMELTVDGGLSDALQRIIKSNDSAKLIAEFKKLILSAYGVKSEDGKRFIKSEQLREEFVQTAAYDALFVELATDENAAVTFLSGLVPKSMSTEAKKAVVAPTDPRDPAFAAMQMAATRELLPPPTRPGVV